VGPAFGAARLAIMGVEHAAVEDICTPPPILNVIEPDERTADLYAHRVRKYRQIYRNLKDTFVEN
jgi:xylulokinase